MSTDQNKYIHFLTVLNRNNVFTNVFSSVVSPLLNYICIISKQKYAYLYLLPNCESNFGPFWQSSTKVQRCSFSEDGKHILLVLNVNSLQIFSINEENVSLLVQVKASVLAKFLENYEIDFSAASLIKPLQFKSHEIIIMIDKTLTVNIEWNTTTLPFVKYSIYFNSYLELCSNSSFICVLRKNNTVDFFSILTGKKYMNVLLSQVHQHHNFTCSSPKDIFFKITVHPDLKILAAVNQDEDIFLFDVEELFKDEKRLTIDTTQKKKEKWLWSYKSSKTNNDVKVPSPYRLLGKVSPPTGLVVSYLQFSLKGLFTFFSVLGQSKSKCFKVVDENSGQVLLSFDDLGEFSIVIGGPFPLIMTDSILSVCLGQLSNDYFFSLLCEILPNFTLSRGPKRTFSIQSSQDIVSLHLVLLKIILNMHLNIFYCNVKSLALNKSDKFNGQCMNKANFLEKKMLKNVDELFTIVLEYKENDESLCNMKQSMLVSCFLHAVHLLGLIQGKNKKYLSCQIFSTLLKHIKILFDNINVVHDPLKDKWGAWINMADEEIIQEALIVDAVALAHIYFVINRKWSVETIENDFKDQALTWIVDLIAMNQFEKAKIALENLGYHAIHYLKTLCLDSNDSDLRDLLVSHFQKINDFSEDENEAWIFIKKMESALTSTVKHYYTFEQDINISAKSILKLSTFKFGSFNGSIDLTTVMKLSKEWREFVLIELYFNTNDITLEKILNKKLCWKYLIESNQIDLLKNWIDITCNNDILDSLILTSDYFFKNFYNLFAQNCIISENMLNLVYGLKCTSTTKNTILDVSAFNGLFSSLEKNCLKALISRFENISALSYIKMILSKPSSNVSLYNFDRMIFTKCINNSLKPIILICLNETTFFDDFTEVKVWVNTWNMFTSFVNIRTNMIIFAELIRKSLQIYECNAEEKSLIDVTVAILEKTEISDAIEKKEKNFTLFSIPLIENYSKIIEIADERRPDVSLYDLLKCSNIPVDKLFLWQKKNSNLVQTYSQEVFLEFPHFNHQILGAQFGFRQNLEYSYYLKQSRPSFACNLFIVESLRSHRRLTNKMIKRACGVAHGLALKYWKDSSIGSSCVAFIAMLGDITSANVLRMHLAVTEFTCNCLEENEHFYISTLLRGIISKDLFYLQEMAYILESFVMTFVNEKKSILTIQKWYQVVFFCISQNLPLPCALLKYLAQNHDWFFFLTYLDVFKYSNEQAVELIEEIDSKILKSHLIRALTRTTLKLSTTSPNKSPPKILLEPGNNIQDDCEMVNLRDNKDIFHSFVSNVYTEVLNTIQTFTDKNLVLPWSCEQDPDYDVLLTLLKCESEPDTSKSLIISSVELQSPVLSILATCFQPDNLFPNFFAWIISSIPSTKTRMKKKEEGQKLMERSYSSNETENLFNNYFSPEYFQTFYRGMKLFMAENPLSIFLEAIYYSIILMDFKNSYLLLKKFIVEITHFTMKETSAFFSKNWILNIVASCIESLLKRSELKSFVKKEFLHMLAESDLAGVDSSFPNYLLWFQICEILESSDTNLDFLHFYDITLVSDKLQNCIDNLLNNFQFSQTLELCSLLGLNKDKCILAMWEHQLEMSIKSEKNFENIWADSSLAFKDENVNPNAAAFFYLKMVSHFKSSFGESLKNKYLAFDYCLHWRKLIEDTLSPSFKEESDSIELEKWMCCLEPEFDLTFLKNSSIDAPNSLLLNTWSASKVLIRCQSLNDYQKSRVEDLINLFLDQEDLYKALRLSAFFKSTNEDLIIISCCLKVSQGELNIFDLSKVSSTISFALQKLSQDLHVENALQLSGCKTFPSKEQQQTLFTLDKLCQTVKHGKSLANKILVSFRLSVNLDLTFKDIASERNYLCFLSRSMASENVNKFNVAKDLIKLADLKSRDLALFLKEKIVSVVIDSHLTDFIMPVKLWDVSLTSDFCLIINLLDDTSLLGLELLQASINLPYKLGIEILIRAHDCFTTSCNVEGIGKILRRARVLAAQALQEEQWQYLVKLLVGIERYTDMIYIFEILKDNNQIEQLLRKGIHKSLGLQIAVSEFLYRQCPRNRELSKMVSVHFGLYFKLAAIWQEEADEIISKIPVVNNILKDSNKTRNALNTALDNYSHAVQWYIQAGKLNKALKVGHRAQIVALQILLIGGPFILKIQSQSELQILLNDNLSVAHTILISRACELEPDWSTALHERWTLKGDKLFYADLKSSCVLSNEILQIYCMRYKHELLTNSKAKERMKQITTITRNSPLEKDLKNN